MLPGHMFHLMSGSTHVQRFNVASRSWSQGPPLPAPLFEGCSVSTDLGLMVIGDFEAGEPNGYILTHDDQWKPLPLTHFTHTNPGCTSARINNSEVVVVVTGDYVEMLRLADMRWIVLPRPNIHRSPEVRPTVGVSFGKLLIAGGLDLEHGDVSDVIEEWDDDLADWRITAAKVDNPTIRHSDVSISLHLMDYCDI